MIQHVVPAVDGGRFPAKTTVGDVVPIEADVFADGHDLVAARILHRREPDEGWSGAPARPLGNDRWRADLEIREPGTYRFLVEGWIDTWSTWRSELAKWVEAGQDVTEELKEGAPLVGGAARRARAAGAIDDADRLAGYAKRLRRPKPGEVRELATSGELEALMARHPDRRRGAASSDTFALVAARERARHGAWYELFPRSASPEPGRHGTLRDVAALVPDVAELGFDVLYLPPIHPIGRTNRKGRNNRPTAEDSDPGSPWAIGAAEGGHTAIHPDLGTFDDFEHLQAELKRHEMELALDLAFQCAPDHPWVQEHPEWFRHRADGTIRFAENPPKRYEDIYPLDFETKDREGLWRALLDVVLFWVDKDVRVFRVDNPHTKPFAFWAWLIDEVKTREPDVLFLSEAFTRPRVMERLAKIGFDQSYTYFTWRRTKDELTAYLTELTQSPVRDFLRANLWPNTPDILTDQLQEGGPPAFRLRFLLAATMGANYGIYGPTLEHMEAAPREPGSEEYLHSEKYEIRTWRSSPGTGMSELIARLNRIRREHPAFQHDRTLRFHPVENDRLIAYSKTLPDGRDPVLVVANLDPAQPQSGWIDVRMPELGMAWDAPFAARDLLTGETFSWRGARNFVQLHPAHEPGHVLAIEPARSRAA
ncbi:MAG TPA: alpha-1,4-glucan--maltose-1-phosphate maltosyltransferase [Actinomycetota bacterium]|nr:alpha-1,4-glucan--maltose-1-phosphate maltosyltransferase [Actinomycetota bacterium]